MGLPSDVVWNIGPGTIDVDHFDDGTCSLEFTGTFRLLGLTSPEALALIALAEGVAREDDRPDAGDLSPIAATG